MIFEENFMICCFNPSHHTGSDPEICFQLAAFRVSIHAPYAGSDYLQRADQHLGKPVSIHAPYAGSDVSRGYWRIANSAFQSTPPMQGATISCSIELLHHTVFQSTHPMQGATHVFVVHIICIWSFRSTPPMQGATISIHRSCRHLPGFNPRPLCRERLIDLFVYSSIGRVSIHAPYAGSDGHGNSVYFE